MELIEKYMLINAPLVPTEEAIGICEETFYNADYRIKLKASAYENSIFVKLNELFLTKNVDYKEIHEGDDSWIEFLTYDELSLRGHKIDIVYMGYKPALEDDLPWSTL